MRWGGIHSSTSWTSSCVWFPRPPPPRNVHFFVVTIPRFFLPSLHAGPFAWRWCWRHPVVDRMTGLGGWASEWMTEYEENGRVGGYVVRSPMRFRHLETLNYCKSSGAIKSFSINAQPQRACELSWAERGPGIRVRGRERMRGLLFILWRWLTLLSRGYGDMDWSIAKGFPLLLILLSIQCNECFRCEVLAWKLSH